MDDKNKFQTIDMVIAIISVIAVLITIIFLMTLCGNYTLLKGELQIQDTGSVGDFFGGVIGSFIGLISVLLLYKTLIYQKDEMVNRQDEIKNQQFEINNNIISNKLQRGTDLLMVLLSEFKDEDIYDDILNLHAQLGESEISLQYIIENINEIETLSSKIDLQFNVINKLIYQDIFDVTDMNLLRLIIYNRLGNDFFSFLNDVNRFVCNSSNLKSIENEVNLIISFQNIKQYLIKPLYNISYRNKKEILDIINNYKAEDSIKSIRLEDWLTATNKKKIN